MSFFWKVLVAMTVVVAVSSLLLSEQIVGVVAERQLALVGERVRDDAIWLATTLRAQGDGQELSDVGRIQAVSDELATALAGCRFTVIAPDGVVLADSHENPEEMENHGQRPEVLDPGTIYERESRTLRQAMVYVAEEVRVDGKLMAYARVARLTEDIEADLAALKSAIRQSALIALGVALVLSLILSSQLTRPLRHITGALSAIAQGDYGRRLPLRSRDEIGQLAGVVNELAGKLRDRIERLERALQQDHAILGGMGEGVIATDAQLRVVLINGAASSLLDAEAIEPKGRPIWEVTRVPDVVQAIARCVESSQRLKIETRVQHAGRDMDLAVSVVPLLETTAQEPEDGNRGCVAVLHDLTELRRLERVRRDFVANVSHELKTPLTAVKGYIESILEDPAMPTETRIRFITKAQRNSERLAAIVSDLLALARIESGQQEAQFASLDLVEVVRRAVEGARESADRQDVRLRLEAPAVPLTCLGDAPALELAVSNLIDNAIKYSPSGGEVRTRVGSDSGALWISVQDQGPGIPAHEQERIFERFYRIDKDRSRTLGGTGLGLSIVKNAVTQHGGQVSVQSEIGKGSTFLIRLPPTGRVAGAPPSS